MSSSNNYLRNANPSIKYRAEIDGLRAIAVLSVILFHAGFRWFSGGFVGVDIFFVISGYLITTIILTEKQNGVFSILNFYERRARRILPALFFIMLVCLPFAWFWMLPDQLIDFSKSLGAVSTFVSNIFFWLNTGYFSATTAEKPLLHTWSLGIEEQYYVLFPLLIILFWRIGHKKLVGLVTTILLLSLILSEYGARRHPSAAFFLILPRAWELLVGSCLAFLSFKGITTQRYFSLKTNQAFSLLGLMLIISSIFTFSEDTTFPGFYALIPVIGAALIIEFSSPNTLTARLLSHKFIVGIGVISYSAYLWHQPLFAFARIYLVNKPQEYIFTLFSILTLLLATLTWKFIERPFRSKNNLSRSQVFLISAIGTLFFTVVGAIGYYQHGFPGRLSANQQALFSVSTDTTKLYNEKQGCLIGSNQGIDAFGACSFKKKGVGHVLLWGDSHAAHLFPGLKAIAQYQKLTQLTASGCPPILDFDFNKKEPRRPYCQEVNKYIFKRIEKDIPDKIILAARWGMHENAWWQLRNTIIKLKNIGVKNIVIVGPAPIWDDLLPHIMARFDAPFSQLPERLKSHFLKDNYFLDKKMKTFAQRWKVDYVSLFSILCNDDGCLTRSGEIPEQLTSFDDGHFTESGSKYVISKFPEGLWAETSSQYSLKKDDSSASPLT